MGYTFLHNYARSSKQQNNAKIVTSLYYISWFRSMERTRFTAASLHNLHVIQTAASCSFFDPLTSTYQHFSGFCTGFPPWLIQPWHSQLLPTWTPSSRFPSLPALSTNMTGGPCCKRSHAKLFSCVSPQ